MYTIHFLINTPWYTSAWGWYTSALDLCADPSLGLLCTRFILGVTFLGAPAEVYQPQAEVYQGGLIRNLTVYTEVQG